MAITIREEFNDLQKVHSAYQLMEEKFERKIKSKVKFVFFIEHKASDGLTLVKEDSADVCLLSDVVAHLEKNATFTKEDMRRNRI